ncbi:hypothetical protein HA402_010683 [Bradysia odoriphaga]|nr:hypothetical protein HA402_010683 [Bradysia odoriphaga]
MAGTLYTYPENFRAYKALIAAQYSGAQVKIASDFVFGETNKSDAFLKKFPSGKVPAFETSNGQTLTESNAIAFYVANEKLRGASDLEKAQVWQWISFADSEILPSSCAWVFPLLGIMAYNKNTVERARADISVALNVLNKHLLSNTFLVGERISLADIIVFTNLLHLYQYVLEPSVRSAYGNVNRWFVTILNQTQVQAVVKNFSLCAKAIEFDPKKYAEFQSKSGGAKEDQTTRSEEGQEGEKAGTSQKGSRTSRRNGCS